MKIKIFGKLTDIFKGNEYNFSLEDPISATEFKVKLEAQFMELKQTTYLIILNGKKAENEDTLTENSEIALLPPYSGG